MVHTRITGLFVLIATLAGCSSTTTQEIKREPARVRFIEVDTRPAPQANLRGSAPQVAPEAPQVSNPSASLTGCHPYARVLAIAALGQPGDRPETGVRVKPDGTVEIGKGVEALVRIGEGEGEKPVVKTPNGGAWSSALTFVSNTTRVPQKGAGLLIAGALFIAGGVAAWWLGAGLRISVALALVGGTLIGVGYLVENAPWVIWLALAAVVTGGVYWIWESRKGRDARAVAEATVPVVEDLPRILLASLTTALPDVSGEKLADVASEAASAFKGAIGGKAKAKGREGIVDRAVKSAKKATATKTEYRGA